MCYRGASLHADNYVFNKLGFNKLGFNKTWSSCRNCSSFVVMVETGWGFPAFLDELDSSEKLAKMDLSKISTRQARKRNIIIVPPPQQWLHKLQFLKNLRRPKPCGDQARLSSLINKQVVPPLTFCHLDILPTNPSPSPPPPQKCEHPPFVSAPRLYGRALCRQLQAV